MKGRIDIKEALSLITHEIKNSIYGIKLGLEEIYESAGDEDKEIISTLLEELEHLSEITMETLTITGPINVTTEEVNLEDLVKDAASVIAGETDQFNSIFTFSFSDDFPEILCDRKLMRMVFLNLINNSFEEVGEDGEIEIGGKYLGDNMVEIWVRDNGEGIEGDMSEIFKKFKSRKKHGTGIGLSLVRRVINEHFGEISVDSQPGTGTTFRIEMPSDFHFIDRRSGGDRRQSQGRRKEDK